MEKNVLAVARGWEEFRSKFPYLGHDWRQNWSRWREVKQWLAGEDESFLVGKEERRKNGAGAAKHAEVEEWLRGGGGLE